MKKYRDYPYQLVKDVFHQLSTGTFQSEESEDSRFERKKQLQKHMRWTSKQLNDSISESPKADNVYRSSQHQNSLLLFEAESINPLTVQLFMSHVPKFSRQMWHLVRKTEVNHMRKARILHGAHRRPPSPCSTAAHTPSLLCEWRVANPCNRPKVS